MKDITISGRLLKRELIIFACFVFAAWLVNVYAVLNYDGPWYELFTQVGFTLTIAIVLYLVRLLLWGISFIVKKIRARR